MNIKVVSFEINDQQKFLEARKVREKVFVVEQKVDRMDEFDNFESDSVHYLMSLNDQVIGTARWRKVDDKIKLERFAVLKKFRNKNYGKKLLEKIIKDCLEENSLLYLHAQLKAIPFYERQGFEKTGNLFYECEIKHYRMELSSIQKLMSTNV